MKTNELACGLFCLSLLVAPVAMAQEAELTAEEIEALFNAQQTRGLVLLPLEGSEETAATEETGDVATTVAVNEDYQQLDDSVQVNIRVAFEFDSAALSPGEQAKLDAVCQAISNSDIPLFRIIGHTDASGADDYNQRLSLLRAEEVERHLINSCGIAPERLEALGVGEAFPFDPNDPRADVNRRVEFQVGS